MPAALLPFRTSFIFLLIAIALRLWAASPQRVERGYSRGVYPYVSAGLRRILGPVPFSMGDVLYLAAGIAVLVALGYGIVGLRHGSLGWARFISNITTTLLAVYLLFETLWGLNYSRRSAAQNFDLPVGRYSTAEVVALTQTLHTRLTGLAPKVAGTDWTQYHHMNTLAQQTVLVYQEAEQTNMAFTYRHPSIKPSLLSGAGKYFGFTGYYNPFTGEAQIKTSIPPFLKPFVLLHEVAHQVGYAKEMEANFVAYLTGKASANDNFRYSVYFEMWLYAAAEGRQRLGTDWYKTQLEALPQVAQQHVQELREYLLQNQNRIEPYISKVYGAFLKWNRQPEGTASYNAVVGWLVAYGKKHSYQNL